MDVLGKRLLKRRKELGRTQRWMAKQLNVDRTTYTKYERGSTEPSLENLCRLAEILDCSADWLLGGE